MPQRKSSTPATNTKLSSAVVVVITVPLAQPPLALVIVHGGCVGLCAAAISPFPGCQKSPFGWWGCCSRSSKLLLLVMIVVALLLLVSCVLEESRLCACCCCRPVPLLWLLIKLSSPPSFLSRLRWLQRCWWPPLPPISRELLPFLFSSAVQDFLTVLISQIKNFPEIQRKLIKTQIQNFRDSNKN